MEKVRRFKHVNAERDRYREIHRYAREYNVGVGSFFFALNFVLIGSQYSNHIHAVEFLKPSSTTKNPYPCSYRSMCVGSTKEAIDTDENTAIKRIYSMRANTYAHVYF